MRIKVVCLIGSAVIWLTGCQKSPVVPSTVYADPFPRDAVGDWKRKSTKPEEKFDDPKYDMWTFDPRHSVERDWQRKKMTNQQLSFRLTVEPDGRLVELKIRKSSGILEVDKAAVETVQSVFSRRLFPLPSSPGAQSFILEFDKNGVVRLARECSKRVGSIR